MTTPPPPHVQPPPAAPAGRRTGLGAALLATLVWTAVNLVLALALAGPPSTPYAAGRWTVALLLPTLLAAPTTWLVARKRPAGWKFPLLVLLALPFYLLFVICLGITRSSSA